MSSDKEKKNERHERANIQDIKKLKSKVIDLQSEIDRLDENGEKMAKAITELASKFKELTTTE